MYWFTEIPALLLVRVVAIWISELPLDRRRVYIATILQIISSYAAPTVFPVAPFPDLQLQTMLERIVSSRRELSELVLGPAQASKGAQLDERLVETA